MRIQTTKLTFEDRFDRKYACWTHNHGGWRKYERGRKWRLKIIQRLNTHLKV